MHSMVDPVENLPSHPNQIQYYCVGALFVFFPLRTTSRRFYRCCLWCCRASQCVSDFFAAFFLVKSDSFRLVCNGVNTEYVLMSKIMYTHQLWVDAKNELPVLKVFIWSDKIDQMNISPFEQFNNIYRQCHIRLFGRLLIFVIAVDLILLFKTNWTIKRIHGFILIRMIRWNVVLRTDWTQCRWVRDLFRMNARVWFR